MDSLKAIWSDLAYRYTRDHECVEELWAEIVGSYTSKKRYYHNLTHLSYMVDLAFNYQDCLHDLDALLFSVFYHDLVYDAKKSDNEAQSADIAQKRLSLLGVLPEKIVHCKHQILATKLHAFDADVDTNYLVDFDLAILGDTPKKYKEYARNIRKEYAIYPDFLYQKGRKKVLRHFLDMKPIFKTEQCYGKYEQQARENLAVELQELVGSNVL